ncbi:MAG: DedA family protein [Nocardioides sp.]
MGIEPLLFGIEFLDLEWWLGHFGEALFWISLAVLFVECGLLFPFLPGDTLLFSIGLFIATEQIDLFPGGVATELTIAMVLMVLAAFAGNVAGYEIGRRIGPPLYERDGRFLRRKHFDRTHEFFDEHGAVALVLGRFVAFVRTFITVVAGATRMDRGMFFVWSFVGAVLWVVGITLLGYFLGNITWLGDNLDFALLAILAVFAIPLVIEWRRELARSRG